jgi:hypothetical protein
MQNAGSTNAAQEADGYALLTPDERKALRRAEDAISVSEEFCRPHFDKMLRYVLLYNNTVPEELDCTFSKVMLPLAFSVVQNELPRSAANLFSSENFFTLNASDPELEMSADAASAWLRHVAKNQNRLFPRIMPTLTRVGIMGTGYRLVSYTPIRRWENRERGRNAMGMPQGYADKMKDEFRLGIVGQNIDVWNVLPSPNATMVNHRDGEAAEAAEWVCFIDYMTKTKLEGMAKKARWVNKASIEHMLAAPPSPTKDGPLQIDGDYRSKAMSSMLDAEQTDWIDQIRTKQDLQQRYRCVWVFFRDRWILVGQGKHLLYDGPPLLDWIPIAKYTDTPNPDSWFGTGLVETVEDVILAYILNFNMRLDYLATTLHPQKFIRDDIADAVGNQGRDFDPVPYGLIKFPRRIQDIQKAIFYDRFPEISPQAFMEETGFQKLMQEITAQPNYMKGQGGANTLANETATGIVSLIEEGTARSTLRAINLEYGGLHDELMLYLKWGKKYAWEDQPVRRQDGTGWPWMQVPADAIDDGFGIELCGSRTLNHKNEVVKRMLSVLPMLINNPVVQNQPELHRQALRKLDIFDNPEALLSPPAAPVGMLGMGGGEEAGIGGLPTVQNETQGVANAMPARTPARWAI